MSSKDDNADRRVPGLDLEVIREFGPFRAYASDVRVDSAAVRGLKGGKITHQ